MAGVIVWVELTESCQLKCRFCYNYWREIPPAAHAEMSESTLSETLDFVSDIAGSRRVTVALAGGDASAHSDFQRIVGKFAQIADVCVVTHGCDLAPEALAAFAATRRVSFQFSIPSHLPDAYRFLTGGFELKIALTNLALVREFGMSASVSAVISSRNQGDGAGLVRMVHAFEADFLLLNRFMPVGRGALYTDTLSINDAEYQRTCDDAAAAAKELGVRVLSSAADPGVRAHKLAAPKFTVAVSGAIRVCSLDEEELSHVRAPSAEVLSAYEQFWRSGRGLANCLCSQS